MLAKLLEVGRGVLVREVERLHDSVWNIAVKDLGGGVPHDGAPASWHVHLETELDTFLGDRACRAAQDLLAGPGDLNR